MTLAEFISMGGYGFYVWAYRLVDSYRSNLFKAATCN